MALKDIKFEKYGDIYELSRPQWGNHKARISAMVPAVTILVFAWTLKGVGDAMGLAQFVGSVVGDHASASIFIRWCCSPWRCSFPFRREPPGERSRFLCRLQRACSQPEQIWR